MRPSERVFLYGGVAAALLMSLASHQPAPASARQASGGESAIRIATMDVYTVTERILQTPEFNDPLQSLVNGWQAKLGTIEQNLRDLSSKYQILPENDPERQNIAGQAKIKQQEYEEQRQTAAQEIETTRATQFSRAYQRARDGAATVANRQGYTHVIATRGGIERMNTTNVASTVQEILARPLIKGIPSDDITQAVLTEMNLQ